MNRAKKPDGNINKPSQEIFHDNNIEHMMKHTETRYTRRNSLTRRQTHKVHQCRLTKYT